MRLARRLHVSKQRAWQIVRQCMGLCVKCGEPATGGAHCAAHAEYDRNYRKKTRGTK